VIRYGVRVPTDQSNSLVQHAGPARVKVKPPSEAVSVVLLRMALISSMPAPTMGKPESAETMRPLITPMVALPYGSIVYAVFVKSLSQ